MSKPLTSTSRHSLVRELYFNRTGIALLLTILCAIGLFELAARTHGEANIFWLTLATGITATAVYASLSILLTTRQLDAFMRTTIQQSVDTQIAHATSELLATVRNQQTTYLPLASYPPTTTPDTSFNHDINSSFASSDRYTFQGITARYSIARLARLPTVFDHIRIIVADPTKPDSVVTRVKRDIDTNNPQEGLEDVRARLTDDIWMSIVGAYLARRKSDSIEFCLVADPPIDRVEIFDQDMFLTRFSDVNSQLFKFPASCRFSRESLMYQMYIKDCARLFTSKYTVRFVIPRENDPGSLIEVLERAGIELVLEEYQRLAQQFIDFTNRLPVPITS